MTVAPRSCANFGGLRWGALALFAAMTLACAHVRGSAPLPRVEIEYHPGFIGPAWALSVYDDGSLLLAELYGPEKRELRVSKTVVRSWLSRTRAAWPAEDIWLTTPDEDVDSILVRVRAEDGPTTVKIDWPTDFACSELVQPAFAVWNDLVRMMGKACPTHPCEIPCLEPSVAGEKTADPT